MEDPAEVAWLHCVWAEFTRRFWGSCSGVSLPSREASCTAASRVGVRKKERRGKKRGEERTGQDRYKTTCVGAISLTTAYPGPEWGWSLAFQSRCPKFLVLPPEWKFLSFFVIWLHPILKQWNSKTRWYIKSGVAYSGFFSFFSECLLKIKGKLIC